MLAASEPASPTGTTLHCSRREPRARAGGGRHPRAGGRHEGRGTAPCSALDKRSRRRGWSPRTRAIATAPVAMRAAAPRGRARGAASSIHFTGQRDRASRREHRSRSRWNSRSGPAQGKCRGPAHRRCRYGSRPPPAPVSRSWHCGSCVGLAAAGPHAAGALPQAANMFMPDIRHAACPRLPDLAGGTLGAPAGAAPGDGHRPPDRSRS